MTTADVTAVVAWLNEQSAETLYLTSVTLAELLFGIAALPSGKRKDRLSSAAGDLIEMYEGRVLSFDTEAAQHYAILAGPAGRAGRGLPAPDGYTAAIAAANGFAIATRDAGAFRSTELDVINPWSARGG